MPEYIDDPLVEDVEVHARSRFSENRDGYHDWQEEVSVTLVVSDELDTYSQRGTYDTLRRLYQMVRTVRSEVLRKELPGYSGYINGEADKLFDEWISPNGRTEVYAETSRNLYRCPSGVVNDYYEVNGKGVYLPTFERANGIAGTPTPTPYSKSGSGSYRKSSGAGSNPEMYGVEQYIDGDDFADEWAEEFGDGDEDEGYDDAYDYWMEHQE